jgi:hypothetical protein
MSPQPTVLAVPWPPLVLGEAGWRRRLEAIADQAEALDGRTGLSYLGWQSWHGRVTFRDLKACIGAVDQRLMGY